jgi:hypothetical protein
VEIQGFNKTGGKGKAPSSSSRASKAKSSSSRWSIAGDVEMMWCGGLGIWREFRDRWNG